MLVKTQFVYMLYNDAYMIINIFKKSISEFNEEFQASCWNWTNLLGINCLLDEGMLY